MTKFVVQAGWDDVPHLSAEAKAEIGQSYLPYQRDARIRGVPQLGAGAIYPVPESEITVAPFALPVHFKRGYGMDVGWNRTAAIWGAHDTQADVVYLYAEHYRGQAEPAVQAQAIKAHGGWIPGVIDPASRGRGPADGNALYAMYVDLGLRLSFADNSVDTGIYEMWTRLSTGRLKVFSTLQNWLAEYRLYRRNEKGAVVKDNDHLMDATRYLVMSGIQGMAFCPREDWPFSKETRHKFEYDPFAAEILGSRWHRANYDPFDN